MHLPLFRLQPIHFIFAGYFKRVVHIVCVPFLPFFFLFLVPSHFQLLYHTQKHIHTHTHTPPSLSIYSHGISKCAFSHTAWGGGGVAERVTRPAPLLTDTCQSLICHLCAEMEMSRSDTTCQSLK